MYWHKRGMNGMNGIDPLAGGEYSPFMQEADNMVRVLQKIVGLMAFCACCLLLFYSNRLILVGLLLLQAVPVLIIGLIAKWRGLKFSILRVELCVLSACVVFSLLVCIDTESALMRASSLRLANSGRQIVSAIFTPTTKQKTSRLEGNDWSSAVRDFSGTTTDFTQEPDSETYFTDLLDWDSAEFPGWEAFAGAGLSSASNGETFLQGNHNVWNVIVGLDDNAADDTPFLFTRNLNITVDDLRNEHVALRSRFDDRSKPFGRKGVVLITKGGQAKFFTSKQLTRKRFLGSGVFNATTNNRAVILKAKAVVVPRSHLLP